jgi:hypothetical protein
VIQGIGGIEIVACIYMSLSTTQLTSTQLTSTQHWIVALFFNNKFRMLSSDIPSGLCLVPGYQINQQVTLSVTRGQPNPQARLGLLRSTATSLVIVKSLVVVFEN